MKIILAKHGGFCFGVKRAVQEVENCLEKYDNVATLGPIIHNPLVVDELKAKGARVLNDIEDASTGDVVVIRSHGIPEGVLDIAKEKGVVLCDATCPFVKRIQEKAKECYEAGIDLIIIGEKEHPEVIGIKGWSGSNTYVISTIDEIKAVDHLTRACVVAQTTTSKGLYDSVVEKLDSVIDDLEIFHSICKATEQRQAETIELSTKVDAMIVVGGKNSSNTQKLYALAKQNCQNTYCVETANDLDLAKLRKCNTIGITSGASTPEWIIKEVYNTMSDIEKKELQEQEAAESIAEEVVAEEVQPQIIETEAVTENTEEPAPTKEASEPEAASTDDETPEQEEVSEEARKEAEDANFMEDLEKTLVTIRSGQIKQGKVVSVNENEVCVNIGYKSDGFITRAEFSTDPDVNPVDVLSEGDEIEVEVLRVNDGEGNVVLSKKNVDIKKNWSKFLEKFEEGAIFEGVGKQTVKGGLIAMIEGIRAFVPASHLDTKYVDDIDYYIGQTMQLKIIEVEKHRRRCVASRKAFLLEEEGKKQEELWTALHEGSNVIGIVRRLTDFGAFVDIGGIDGLVHVTDLAWGRVNHPKDVVSIGQEIEVRILKVDIERKRVSLGFKQLLPKPWEIAESKYSENDVIEGKVVRIVPFGAFIEIEPGLDGLVHISQIANKRIEKVEDVLEVGQMVKARVLSVNAGARRISLSIRDAEKPAETEEAHTDETEFSETGAIFYSTDTHTGGVKD